MALGGLAYVVMFALNMLGQPWALMVGINILHGFCFGFLFVVASMYVDKAASTDIKASAQSLFVFVVYGLFNVVGNVGAGYIRDHAAPQLGRDLGHPPGRHGRLPAALRGLLPRGSHRQARAGGRNRRGLSGDGRLSSPRASLG